MDATSFKRVLNFFICLGTPVNIIQYWGSVGIFNNHNFAFRPKFTSFTGHTCWSTNHMYFKLYLAIFSMNLVLFLVFAIAVLSPRCSFYITSRNTYTSVLVITVALISDYLWFTCNLLLLCGNVELSPGLNQNTAKKLLFFKLYLVWLSGSFEIAQYLRFDFFFICDVYISNLFFFSFSFCFSSCIWFDFQVLLILYTLLCFILSAVSGIWKKVSHGNSIAIKA